MIHSDRDSLDSMIDGSRILALICYCLAMALPAQNTIRTTYGIEAFVFSLAAAVYFAHSNEMRLLLWSGYLNICIICLVGSWLFFAVVNNTPIGDDRRYGLDRVNHKCCLFNRA